MEKAFVAQRVATKLFSTEAAVDQAMVEATELLADLLLRHVEVPAPVDHVRNLLPVGYVAVVADQALEQRTQTILTIPIVVEQPTGKERSARHQLLLDKVTLQSGEARDHGRSEVAAGEGGSAHKVAPAFQLSPAGNRIVESPLPE